MSRMNFSDEEFELLLAIDIGIADFSSSWAYCDRLSSYMAKMIGHNRTDSLLYSNLFSSALNELLETAFRLHGDDGSLVCTVLRKAGTDRIELTIPCGAEHQDFYRRTMDRVTSPDAAEQYRHALFADGPLDPGVGLMELAVDYNAAMRLETVNGDAVRLIADFALEESER